MRQLRRTPPAATAGLWHVRSGGDSAVLKLVAHRDDPASRWPSSTEPAHPWYWRREPLAYESELLARLEGGLRTPRLRAAVERDDGAVALWLEDVPVGGPWSPERLGEVAFRLGAAQAASAADPLLDPSLSRGCGRTSGSGGR